MMDGLRGCGGGSTILLQFPAPIHSGQAQLFSSPDTFTFLKTIDEERAARRYAHDKWSIKQIVGHITDHERIKIFRAFQLSRNQAVQLWGYDQNFLVDNSRFEELTFQQLRTGFLNVRKASISFVEALSESQLKLIRYVSGI